MHDCNYYECDTFAQDSAVAFTISFLALRLSRKRSRMTKRHQDKALQRHQL